jgi:hypothetical protein
MCAESPRPSAEIAQHCGTVNALEHDAEAPVDLVEPVGCVGVIDRRSGKTGAMDKPRDSGLTPDVVPMASLNVELKDPSFAPIEDLGRTPATDDGPLSRFHR